MKLEVVAVNKAIFPANSKSYLFLKDGGKVEAKGTGSAAKLTPYMQQRIK